MAKRPAKPRSPRAAAAPRRIAPPKSITIRRAYDKAGREDGKRILVDRLWPRGVARTDLALDAWPRELTPSTALRKWYGHKPELFAEFRRRYREEIAAHPAALAELRALVAGQTATLITATREIELSHAVVLRELLEGGKN